ncbi:unnamed protein product, partial [Heterotrigona itama]
MRVDEEARLPGTCIGSDRGRDSQGDDRHVCCAHDAFTGGCGGEPGVARRVIRGRRGGELMRGPREDTRCALRELTRESRVPATETRNTGRRNGRKSRAKKKTCVPCRSSVISAPLSGDRLSRSFSPDRTPIGCYRYGHACAAMINDPTDETMRCHRAFDTSRECFTKNTIIQYRSKVWVHFRCICTSYLGKMISEIMKTLKLYRAY